MELVCRGISKRFHEKIVYSDAQVVLEEGKIYGLLGRNGVGKTTFMNCLSGIDTFDTGELLIKDKNMTRPLTVEDVGYVLATPMLPEFMTGLEFVQFYIDLNKTKELKSAHDYLDLMKISREDSERLIRDYSLGMKNKLQLLLPVIAQPKIILLDEPLTSFDVIVAEEMKQLLTEMKEDRIIIFSTHILQLAQELCDCLILVNNHKLEIWNQEDGMEKSRDMIIKKLQGGDA